MAHMHAGPEPAGDRSLTKLAAGLAAAALPTMVILNVAGADGPIWILQGVFALGAAIVGWRAGGTSPRNPLAFAAFVVGTVLFLLFLGFLISEA
jgi:4-hydroxybenzoate polyprenyltransferase